MNQLFGQPADPDRASTLDMGPTSSSMRPLPVGGAEQAFFHFDIKRSLQLHWRLARNVAIAGVFVAALYFLAQAFLFKSWPAYEATSLVYVQPTPPRVFEPAQGASARWPYDANTYESYIQQQMVNVSREDVLADALTKLKGFQGPKESEQAAALRLVRTLNVTREGTSYQFAISARAPSAQLAADIANAVTQAYMEAASRDQKTGDAERLTILRDERDRIQKAMEADRAEQGTLNRQLGVASVLSTPDHYDEEISQTRQELVKARTDHDAAEAKFAALGAGHGPTSAAIDAEADTLIANDAGLVSMKTALNARRALLISQMANLTPSHPQYKQDEVELAKINNTLDEMMKDLRAKAATRIQSSLQADLQRTAGVESEMNGQLRTLVSAAGGATPKMQRSSDLAADLTRLQARYSTVDEQLHNLMLEDNGPAAAYQITQAQVPLGRTKSGVMRNSVMIAMLGVMFGVLAAILMHKLDPRVYIASDVELILGFPPMAQLPDFTQVSDGVAEEYLLRLSSSIEHARKQSNLRSCVFTGTNEGNGVTMLVGRVGEMLEAMGRPTVLVNATASAVMDLRDRLNSVDGVVPGGSGLVPVGRVSRPTAVLQQMAEETETQDESIVLTDTAPISVSAETEYLARFVDCAIVVIESGKTRRRELREVAATLQRLDVAAVGFVLNRVGLAKADPAFKASVSAIEKHLRSQGSATPRRPEQPKPFTVQTADATEEVEHESASTNSAMRSLFEPEIAAAAAAVARMSSPAVDDLSSPKMTVPGDEAARRFTSPLNEEKTEAQGYRVVPERAAVPVFKAATVDEPVLVTPISAEPIEAEPIEAEPVVAESVDATTITARPTPVEVPGVEPTVEAAHHLASENVARFVEPVTGAASAPFIEAANRFSSGSIAGQGSARFDTSNTARPFADVANHFTHVEAEEPAESAVPGPTFALLDETEKFHSLEYLETPAVEGEESEAETSNAAAHEATHEATHAAEPDVALPSSTVEEAAVHPVDVVPVAGSFAEAVAPAELVAEQHASVAETVAALPIAEEMKPAVAEPQPEVARALPPEPEPISHRDGSPAGEIPWWLSDANRHGEPQRPPVLWKPAKVWMSEDRAAARTAASSAPSAADKAQAAEAPSEVKAAGNAEPARPTWERVPNGHAAAKADQPSSSIQPEGEEAPSNLTSRLSGLRNLLFVMGVKDPHNPEEPVGRYPNIGGTPEHRPERKPFDRMTDPDADFAIAGNVGGASPRLVTAPPEFLPPEPIVINVDKDSTRT